MLWGRFPLSDLQQVFGFLRVLQFPQPIKLTPIYGSNNVKSGVKHHIPPKLKLTQNTYVRGNILIKLPYQQQGDIMVK
jgi:hypothetical protein